MSKYLSICAVFRNEAPYLKEWLDFHIRQGVEHFYLYNNDSTDDFAPVIAPYKSMITLHNTMGYCQQRVAYNHMVENHGTETTWCAFIDVDEFLFPTHGNLKEWIQDFTDGDDYISAIAVHWVLYGSSHEQAYRDVPVTKRFTWRAATVNPHIKSIVRMSDAICMGNDPHSFRVKNTVVDENLRELALDYAISHPATADKIRINHYHTKSKEEYMARKKLPDANSGEYKDFQKMWEAHDVNEMQDYILV
jgi:hypothetical protein